MLQDKRQDLTSEKQKKLLERMVQDLSSSHPDFYYRSTSDVALLIEQQVAVSKVLNAAERQLLDGLGRRDIEMLLSLH